MADQSASSPYSTGSSAWNDVPAPLTQIYQQGFGQLGQQLARPYTTYNNPRIADLTGLQQQAMSTASGLTGSLGSIYQSALNAIGGSPSGGGGGGFSASAGGGGYGFDPSKLKAYTPDVDKSKMETSTGAWINPGVASSYMSPYTTGVIDRIAQLGQRNLQENLLPGINSTFTGAGQFGSTRNANFNNRALRDTQEAILGEQAKALEQGYSTAGNLFSSDAARALQSQQGTASNLLGLGNLGLSANTAANQAQLQAGQINSEAATRMASVGVQSQANALNAEQNRVRNYLDLASGMAGNIGNAINLQNSLGGQQQNLNQQNLDLAYKDYMNQQNYPMSNLQNVLALANPIANATGVKTTANSYVTPGLSGAQRATGLIGGLGQLASNGVLDSAGSFIGSLF